MFTRMYSKCVRVSEIALLRSLIQNMENVTYILFLFSFVRFSAGQCKEISIPRWTTPRLSSWLCRGDEGFHAHLQITARATFAIFGQIIDRTCERAYVIFRSTECRVRRLNQVEYVSLIDREMTHANSLSSDTADSSFWKNPLSKEIKES